MKRRTPPSAAGTDRADRLKSALKANLARRKGQARARAAGREAAETGGGGGEETGSEAGGRDGTGEKE